MRKLPPGKLVIATHNQGKLEEFSALLRPYGIVPVSASELGLPEPRETEDTFVGNARIKAHAAAGICGLPALGDDSGLTVDALGGAPGVRTADWAETGQGRDFSLAMQRTWSALEVAAAEFPRIAQFRCTLVLAWPDGVDIVVAGVLPGQIVWPMRGPSGHGYDPIFQPDGFTQTLGEMPLDEKNRISHRADALRRLAEVCFT
ncbi:MAG: non-canonical purine NTP pyrophosphatase [Sphingomonadales bacterium]|nr:non-canonical purine NTP pyrophosphatase [Sphingomonadales bacterium]